MIEHLTEKDYLTSFDGKAFSNLGERLENIEKENELLKTIKLENVKSSFKIGTDKNGTDISNGLSNGEISVGLQGQTLVNLARINNFTTDEGTGTSVHHITGGYSVCTLKGNTKYTIICTTNNTSTTSPLLQEYDEGRWVINQNGIKFTSGLNIHTFTTQPTTNRVQIFKHEGHTVATTFSNIILLEGDHTNKTIQYFEGLKSVGQTNNNTIEILSVGKNLFDGKLEQGGINENNGLNSENSAEIRSANYIRIKPFTTYMVSRKNGTNYTKYRFYDRNFNYIGGTANLSLEGDRLGVNTTRKSFKVLDNRVAYIRFVDVTNDLTNVYQFEEGTTASEYEPHQSNKKKVVLDEPLRSLPNGVKDEIVFENGKWQLIRRCGEVVLDGSERWALNPHSTDTMNMFWLDGAGAKEVFTNIAPYMSTLYNDIRQRMMVDRFGIGERDIIGNVCIHIQPTVTWFTVSVDKSKTEFSSVENFKQWLSQNNVTVVYELDKPIITEIEPILLDSYENGTLFIDSAIVPASIHQVVLKNMNFFVEKNIKEIAKLRERLNKLQSFYDVSLLEVDYGLTKEKFEYAMATMLGE